MATHPMQPVERGDDGIVRFKQNAIIHHLVDSLNSLSMMDFSTKDQMHFAQPLGMPVERFAELGFATQEMVEAGYSAADALLGH